MSTRKKATKTEETTSKDKPKDTKEKKSSKEEKEKKSSKEEKEDTHKSHKKKDEEEEEEEEEEENKKESKKDKDKEKKDKGKHKTKDEEREKEKETDKEKKHNSKNKDKDKTSDQIKESYKSLIISDPVNILKLEPKIMISELINNGYIGARIVTNTTKCPKVNSKIMLIYILSHYYYENDFNKGKKLDHYEKPNKLSKQLFDTEKAYGSYTSDFACKVLNIEDGDDEGSIIQKFKDVLETKGKKMIFESYKYFPDNFKASTNTPIIMPSWKDAMVLFKVRDCIEINDVRTTIHTEYGYLYTQSMLNPKGIQDILSDTSEAQTTLFLTPEQISKVTLQQQADIEEEKQ